jgi:hypothetical protein
LFAVAIAAMVFSVLACRSGAGLSKTVRGSGKVIKEDRAVSGFSGVELATTGTLHIEVGERETLRIEAEDNLLPHIETEVREDVLTIGTQRDVRLQATQPVHYYLSIPDLDAIGISSSGDVEVSDVRVDRLAVTLSSSGDLSMGEVACDALVVRISSSGDVAVAQLHATTLEAHLSSSGHLSVASGEVEQQAVTIDGSGDYTAGELMSVEAEVTLTSSGKATVRVRDHLQADLSGSGDLSYAGNPTVDARTRSSGQVARVGE